MTDQLPDCPWPKASHVVDARGLLCPHPLIRLRAAIKALPPPSEVVLVATDPHTSLDLEVYCEQLGFRMEAEPSTSDLFWFRIQTG